MKKIPLLLLVFPGLAFANWSAPGLNAFKESTPGLFVSDTKLAKGALPLALKQEGACWQPAETVRLNQMLSLKPCEGETPQWKLFREGDYQVQIDTRSGTPTLMLSVRSTPTTASADVTRQCPKWDGKPLTVDVSKTFAEGSGVRDFYSGQTATVRQGKITLMPAANSNGLLLLERAAK